jgi:hypothetical protein
MTFYASVCDGIGALHLAWQPLGLGVPVKRRSSKRGIVNPGLPGRTSMNGARRTRNSPASRPAKKKKR